MDNKLDLILEKLNSLEKRVQRIEDDCAKMSNHINFINRIYSTVKIPFYKALSIMNSSPIEVIDDLHP
jgi:hypothetical protein